MANRRVVRKASVSKSTEVTKKFFLVTVVYSQASTTECTSLQDVATKIREVIRLHGIHAVQLFVFAGDRVALTFDGDPLSPGLKLSHLAKDIDVYADKDGSTLSEDGWLFRQDTQAATDTMADSGDELGFF